MKTRRFAKPGYVGDPINAVRIFNEKEVDELLVLDIEATRQGRGPDFALIEELAGECFMPLCYGGGIRSFDDARTLFSLGVEKVSLQTVLLTDPAIVRRIADHAGEQAVVASIDVKRNWLGKLQLHSASGAPLGPRDWRRAIADAVAAGAGEILLNAVDRDGMMQGVDADLIREASGLVDVPLVAMGGVGSLDHLRDAIAAGASAVAAGAFFVFQGPHRAVLITYPSAATLKTLWEQTS